MNEELLAKAVEIRDEKKENQNSATRVGRLFIDVINKLSPGYGYMGMATPSASPAQITQKCFYQASSPGTYVNFGALVVKEGEIAYLLWDGISWRKETYFDIVNNLTTGGADKALSAEMGKKLSEESWINEAKINSIKSSTKEYVSTLSNGAMQTKGIYSFLHGVSYELVCELSNAENTDIYFGIKDSGGNIVKQDLVLNKNTTKKTFSIIPSVDWIGASIYCSVYFDPTSNNSLTISVKTEDYFANKEATNAELTSIVNRAGFVIYPYSDQKLNFRHHSSGKLLVDFTGFNIKYVGKSYERTKSQVLSDIGQTDEVLLSATQGLYFDTSTLKFTTADIAPSSNKNNLILVVGCQFGQKRKMLNYIYPSLTDYVVADRTTEDFAQRVIDYKLKVFPTAYSGGTNNLRVVDNTVVIEKNGISLVGENKNYYIGYVEGEDTQEEATYSYISGSTRTFLCIDTTALIPEARVSFKKALKLIPTNIDEPLKYIVLASWNSGKLIDTIFTAGNRIDDINKDIDDINKDIDDLQSYQLLVNISPDNIYIEGKSVHFKPNGFGIIIKDKTYWIADVTKQREDDYVYEFSQVQSFLAIDKESLTAVGSRNELSNVVKMLHYYDNKIDLKRYIPIFYYYGVVYPLGHCKDIFFKDEPTAPEPTAPELTNATINNDILFSPEFYAYLMGRRNNTLGVGTGWYERFSLVHISDTHQYNALLEEGISVINDKVMAIVNTGDDSNGLSSSDADMVKTQLSATAQVASKSSIPYIGVPGNHDVTGLTKQDYWDRISSVVDNKSSVTWGNKDGYRAYGYIDFVSEDYEGNYRVIMLDPFDYDDGMFETTYAFQTAVFSQKQIDWLIDALLDAANKGYNVFTAMHYSFGDNNLQFNEELAKPDAKFYQDAFMIPDIIDAIQNKEVFSRSYSDEKGVNNITINRDFSSAGNLNFIAHLFGHIHSKNHYRCQKTDGSKKYDILMLGEAALGTYGNALNKAYRKAGTINAIAFSALEIDPIEQCVYRVSYGSYLNYDKSNSERTTKIPYRFNMNN